MVPFNCGLLMGNSLYWLAGKFSCVPPKNKCGPMCTKVKSAEQDGHSMIVGVVCLYVKVHCFIGFKP